MGALTLNLDTELQKLATERAGLIEDLKILDSELNNIQQRRHGLTEQIEKNNTIFAWGQRLLKQVPTKTDSEKDQCQGSKSATKKQQDWAQFISLVPRGSEAAKTASELWQLLPQIEVNSNCNAVHNKLSQLKQRGLVKSRKIGPLIHWYREDRPM